jgi:tRNA threonylcarbamoyladenosine biosynthesis protein TsaE
METHPPDIASSELCLQLGSRRDTARLGRLLGRSLVPGDLVLLEGELGAGKTSLVQSIVRALGVPSDQPVTSPTFEILHEFHGRCPIVHADLYRLDPSESLEELGLLQRVGGDAVVLIEWGERFAAELGDQGVRLTLELGQGSARRCTLCARAERGAALFTRLANVLLSAGVASV